MTRKSFCTCVRRAREEELAQTEARRAVPDIQPEIEFDVPPANQQIKPRAVRQLRGLWREHTLLHLQPLIGNHAVQRAIDHSRSSAAPIDDLAQRLRAASTSGRPIDTSARERLETSLDADLSAVKIHTDDEADQLSQALDARAFATGQDIFFREGQYEPETTDGLWLLAHETTHTIQQASNTNSDLPQRKISQPGDATEREAEAAADYVLSGQRSRVNLTSSINCARGLWDTMTGAMSKVWASDVSPNIEQLPIEDDDWMKGAQSGVRGLVGATKLSGGSGQVPFQGYVPPDIDVPPAGWVPPPPGFVPETPALHGNWAYGQSVPNRAALGHNVQRDHVIAQEKLRDVLTDPMGVSHYDTNTKNALTVLEETGAANAAHDTLPHTRATSHDIQSDIAEIDRIRQQGRPTNWAEDIIEPSRQARLRSGYDPAAVDRGWIDQMGRMNQSQRMADTAEELARLETSGARPVSTIPEVEGMNWADFEPGPSASSAEETMKSASKARGGFLNKVLGGMNYGLQFAGNLMGGQDVGESAFGAAAGGFVGNRVSGGPWDIALNLVNAGLSLGGASQEVTGFSQMAANATPSGFATSLASSAGRAIWNVGEGIFTGDWSGIKRQGQDIVEGRAGEPLQGYGMMVDALTGGNMNYAVDKKAKSGERGMAVAMGNYIADEWFPLINRPGGFGSTLGEVGGYLWEGARGKGGIKGAANFVTSTVMGMMGFDELSNIF